MNFLNFRDGRNVYDFECPQCHAQGELGVSPEKIALVECPNKCGAQFMQRRTKSLFGKPVLEHVFSNSRSLPALSSLRKSVRSVTGAATERSPRKGSV